MRIKRRTLRIAGIFIVLIVLIGVLLWYLSSDEQYGVDDEGFLHAPLHPSLHGERMLVFQDENVTLYRTTYVSNGAVIVGNLYVPNNVDAQHRAKGMMLLPGGGVTKEGEARTARAFAKRNMVVLTIDQRGVGETGGGFNSLDRDYALFASGQVPTMHLLVMDALAGVAYLRDQPEVAGKVIIAGESMGGRAAMVAARMSTDISGLLVISSSGFGNPAMENALQQRFITSFDPDANINHVTVPIVFVHSKNDSVVPLSSAQATYARATAPKKFYIVDNCLHGYCAAMEPLLNEGLSFLS